MGFCVAQTKSVPKTLKQAVKFLDRDYPDSLKQIIKSTEDNNLGRLSYPQNREYKTIFNWTSHENQNSRIAQYLTSKGIKEHQKEVILISFKRFLLGLEIVENEILNLFREIEIKWVMEDSIRFTTDSLRGIYIPKDIEDCLIQIDSFWSDSTKLRMKNLTENEFSGRLHLGFGTWMRNNWQLWGSSRLTKYFNDKGIYHPEAMSGLILDSYYRKLNGRDIRLDEQIKNYQESWKQAELARKEQKQEEFAAYRIGDTLLYKYKLGYVSKRQELKYDDDICIAKGIVTEQNNDQLLIKIKLIESCDRKGIINFDNKNYTILNEKTKVWEKPKKRVKKLMKANQENWFNYDDWETK